MQFTWRTILVLLLSCFLQSCADKDEELSAQNLAHQIPAKDLQDANSIAKNAQLVCEKTKECPESIGLYIASTEKSVLECTSFLIGSDLVLTNAHCLPLAVKLNPSLCKERIKFVFPAGASGEEETISCKNFLGASSRPNAVSPDLALFQLEKSSSKPALSINTKGITNGQQLVFYGIIPTQKDSPKGILQKNQCLAVANSFRFPIYKTSQDSVYSVGDCESKPGNSGSPLIDENGSVVAIIQAFLPLQNALRSRLSAYESFTGEPGKISIATNMRCFDLTIGNVDQLCPPIDTSEVKAPSLEDVLKIDDLQSTLEKDSQEKLQSIMNALDPTFLWNRRILNTNKLERTETFSPKCFLYPFLSTTDKIVSKIPTLETKMSFNRFYQMSAKFTLGTNADVSHSFDLNQLRQQNAAEVKEIRESEEINLGMLPFCS